jgi:phage tail sheath protein FI
LVCVLDLTGNKDEVLEAQQLVVNHCDDMGDRFAILDSYPGALNEDVWDQWSKIDGRNGALYYPWVKVRSLSHGVKVVPPCGHIAGVYARTDFYRGVHKAPANEVLEGVLDLERHVTDADQDDLNPKRVNCLRSFPGRGIRVWGARTLSGERAWTYINVRRLFLTAARWIDWNMQDVVFEPNNPRLWARIERELGTYFKDQFRAGALKGRTPEEAFYVKCNAETNPPELRELGQVVTEIGLAPTIPFEFVVVRMIHGEKGVTITGPSGPA